MSDSQEQIAKSQRPSRRAFLVTSAGACGAFALWSLRPAGRASAASGKTTTPGMVTIVQFGADGKKTGKVVVAEGCQIRCGMAATAIADLLSSNSPGRHGAALHR